MLSALQTGLTALTAVGRKLGVTAHNVANVNTDGFRPQHAVLQEAAAGGVQAQVVAPAERSTATPPPASPVPSAVELPTEMTSLILAKRGYQANIKAVQAADEMERTLLDLRE